MALTQSCDGCGAAAAPGQKFERLGFVCKRDYCADCAPKAQSYLKARDRAQERAAEKFAEKMEKAAGVVAELAELPE